MSSAGSRKHDDPRTVDSLRWSDGGGVLPDQHAQLPDDNGRGVRGTDALGQVPLDLRHLCAVGGGEGAVIVITIGPIIALYSATSGDRL